MSLLDRLLNEEEGMVTGLMTQSAIDQYKRGLTPFPPSHMDPIMGAMTSDYIHRNLGPGFLSGPVAQASLQTAIANRQGKIMGGLGPMDFISAAYLQSNSNTLRQLAGGRAPSTSVTIPTKTQYRPG